MRVTVPTASVWLRTNPKEHVGAGWAATDGFVDAIQEAVAQNGQREPIGRDEIGRKFRIHAPPVRPGRAQDDVVAYGQAQDANRRRWWRICGYDQNLGAEPVDRADIRVVR